MKIRKDIQDAIQNYLIEHNKTGQDLADDLGTTQGTVSRWLTGATKTIKPAHWVVLAPLIKDFLESYDSIISDNNSPSKAPADLSLEEALLLDKYRRMTNSQKTKLHKIAEDILYKSE